GVGSFLSGVRQPNPAEAPRCGPVELGHVALGQLLVERRGITVPQVLECLVDLFLEVAEALVALAGLVPVRRVVSPQGIIALRDQVTVLLGEQIELPVDQLAKAAQEDHVSSRYSSR